MSLTISNVLLNAAVNYARETVKTPYDCGSARESHIRAISLAPKQHAYRLRAERGAVMIEFSLSATVGFFVIISILSVMVFQYQRLALQHALSLAARHAVTGEVGQDSTRLSAITEAFVSHGRSYGLGVTPSNLKICPGSMPECPGNDPGLSGGFVVLTASYPAPLPGVGAVNIEASALVKNEPF